MGKNIFINFDVALEVFNNSLHDPDFNAEIMADLLGYDTENMSEDECKAAVYAFMNELNDRLLCNERE